jgi:hypothetical protein
MSSYDETEQRCPMDLTNHVCGFSLVELLLVVGIVGLVLWVLIPLGLRARIEAEYGVVRQHCSELASYTSQWAQQAIMAQDEERSVAALSDYYGSLAGLSQAPVQGAAPGEWVANSMGPSNWRRNGNVKDAAQGRPIDGRYMKGENPSAPEATVADLLPPSHPIVNPFTEVSVFDVKNHPRSQADGGEGAVPGAIALGGYREEAGGWVYFAFVFQGVQNAEVELDGDDTFLPHMNLETMPGLRAGVFAARLP